MSSFERDSETELVLLNVQRNVARRRCIMLLIGRSRVIVLQGKWVCLGGHGEVPRHDIEKGVRRLGVCYLSVVFVFPY
jgi:hypothetical protein